MGEIDDIFNKTAKATKLSPITSDDLKRTKEEQPSGVQVGSSKKSLKKSKRKAHNGLTSNSRSQAKQSNSKAAECLDFKNDSVETVEFQPLIAEESAVFQFNSGQTDDGLPIYTDKELNIGTGGETAECPFDCWCCF